MFKTERRRILNEDWAPPGREPLAVIHIRAVSPTDITPVLVASLSKRPGVLNLIVLGGVARNPDGDAVQFDVITAEANDVLHDMRALGVARGGSVIIEDVGAELSDRANDAERPRRRERSDSRLFGNRPTRGSEAADATHRAGSSCWRSPG